MADEFDNQESMTLSDGRAALLQMPERLEGGEGVIPLTRHGKPVLAVMTWEYYESIRETMDILSDPDVMAQLMDQGPTIPWEEVKAKWGGEEKQNPDTKRRLVRVKDPKKPKASKGKAR